MDSDRSRQNETNPSDDATAFDEFVANSRKDLERRARAAGIPAEDCADVVQEALAAASQQLNRGLFRRASSVATWVYTILGGKILDYWKLAYNRHFARTRSIDTRQEQRPTTEPVVATSPDKELQIAVREALALLPPRERFLLGLKYYEEFTVPEIAVQLRWSERQVERVLAQARERFRQIILSGANPRRHRLIDKGE